MHPSLSHQNLYGVKGGGIVPCLNLNHGTWLAVGALYQTVGILNPIQEDQRAPREAGDMVVYLRVLLAGGLSWFGVVGLLGMMTASPFAWFVIQSALFDNDLIPLPSSPLHFLCLKKTRLSLSQSFLFTNISKVNGCGACGFSQPSSCLLR